jgi:hypothetical protein
MSLHHLVHLILRRCCLLLLQPLNPNPNNNESDKGGGYTVPLPYEGFTEEFPQSMSWLCCFRPPLELMERIFLFSMFFSEIEPFPMKFLCDFYKLPTQMRP